MTDSATWQDALTVIQCVKPPMLPPDAEAMTVVIEYPPGDPGAPPHRHPFPGHHAVCSRTADVGRGR